MANFVPGWRHGKVQPMGLRHLACQLRWIGHPAAMHVAHSQQTKVVRIPPDLPHTRLIKWWCLLHIL